LGSEATLRFSSTKCEEFFDEELDLVRIIKLQRKFYEPLDILDKIEIEYESEKTLKSPDIIFIHKKDFHPSGSFMSFDKNKITKIDKNTILFNNHKYKLDFILHSTDTNNTCPTCAHCISGIHYNGEQYYHDSGYTDLMLKCNSKFVEIPCTLIHQKWVNDIDKADTYLKSKNYTDVKDICLFNIQKCFHKTTDITSQNLNKNIILEDNMCFNNLFNLIYGYIKINDDSSLSKEEIQSYFIGITTLSSLFINPSLLFNFTIANLFRISLFIKLLSIYSNVL
jgi:hypothetical protein